MTTRILFSDKRCFWKEKIVVPVDVLMVQHLPQQVIEIIARDHEYKCEAPRLYVSEKHLLSKMGVILGSDDVDSVKTQYLLDNMIVSLHALENKSFELTMELNINGSSKVEDFLIAKPRGLGAYMSPFVHIISKSIAGAESFRADQHGPERGIVQFRRTEPGNPTKVESPAIQQPLAQLSSPMKTMKMSHGAPPKPLYQSNSSTSSNLINPVGSTNNPRIMPRHVATLLIMNQRSSPPPSPRAPSRRVSASAPNTPHHSRASSPHGNCSDDRGNPHVQHVFRSSALTGLGIASRSASPRAQQTSKQCLDHTHTTHLSDDSTQEDIVGLYFDDSEGERHPAAASLVNILLPPTSPRRPGPSEGMPPLPTPSRTSTHQNADSHSWEPPQGATMKSHQRRHTFDHAVSMPSSSITTAADTGPGVGADAADMQLSPQSTAFSERLLGMGMRRTLDGLHFPFMHSRSKVSPSVSVDALDDLHEMEVRAFG